MSNKQSNTQVEFTAPVNRGGARRRTWFVAFSVAIVCLSVLLQIGCIHGEAVIDDKRLISDFDGRGCGLNPAECFHNMMFGFYYRPLLAASIALGQQFHDNQPIWFHIENLALHALAVAMALLTYRLLFKRRLTALIGGLFFAIHPIQVCFTTFMGGRTESLVAIFILMFVMGVYNAARRVRMLRRGKAVGAGTNLRIGVWITASIVGVLGAAFSKEQVLPIVFLAPLIAMPLRTNTFTKRKGRLNNSIRPEPPPYWTAIYLIPVLVFLLAAKSAFTEIDFVNANWSTAMHLDMVGRTLWSYTKIFLFPTVVTQHATTLGAWEPPQMGVALLGWLAAATWLFLLLRNIKDRPRLILILWASLGIFSCLNVIPVPTQFASAYRAGIPLFGFAGMLASLLEPDRISAKSRQIAKLAPAAALCMALWCAIVTLEDVPNWHDEPALMAAEVASDPNFVCARASLADFDLQRGQVDRAESQLHKCLFELFGPYATPEDYVGLVRASGMIRTLQSASTLRYYRPVYYIPQIIREHGKCLMLLHRQQEAIPDLRAALKLDPRDDGARAALERCYRELNESEKADAVHRMDDILLGRKL